MIVFFSEPPAHFARSTDADGRRTIASATCGGKNSSRCANQPALVPERHAAFARAGRPGKKSIVCECLRLIYLLVYRIDLKHLLIAYTNSFGDDPEMFEKMSKCFPGQDGSADFSAMKDDMMKKMMEMCCGTKTEDIEGGCCTLS